MKTLRLTDSQAGIVRFALSKQMDNNEKYAASHFFFFFLHGGGQLYDRHTHKKMLAEALDELRICHELRQRLDKSKL